MSYYILPKNINQNILISPIFGENKQNIITSYSIYNYYNETITQLKNIIKNVNDISFNNIEELLIDFNPYEYIFSKVPGSKFSVSKLKTNSNLFYEFLEISNTLNCLESFKNKNMKFIHIGENLNDIMDCVTLLREDKREDEFFHYHENMVLKDLHYFSFHNFVKTTTSACVLLNDAKDKGDTAVEIKKSLTQNADFIFYELYKLSYRNINDYTLHLVKAIIHILKYQTNNGMCIIQLNDTIHKPVIELIYLISSLFEKIYIIKPNSSNIVYFNKFLVCKNFIYNDSKKDIYRNYYQKLNEIILNYKHEPSNIISIMNNEPLPYYFMNKIDDINIIIGQQQLECIDQIINIFKNNNKKERMEYIRKINIQKSVNWCEKFKIPCNKFLEKTNIFLPFVKEE